MADPIFEAPRLAEVYDPLDPAGASPAVAGTMTANVAQVFLTDTEWALTLQAA